MQARLFSAIARRLQPSASRLLFIQTLTLSTEATVASADKIPSSDSVSSSCEDRRLGHKTTGNSSSSSPSSSSAVVQTNIWAVERLGKGKWFSDHDRKQDRIPGYIYDQENTEAAHVLIVMDKYQIRSLWSQIGEEQFMVTIFTLEVYDGMGSNSVLYKESVIPRRINYDKKGAICNIGFLRAPLGMKLRLDSPIRLFGQENCIGIRKGGYLKHHLAYVTFLCLPGELPPRVEVSVDKLDIGDKIFVEDLKLETPLHPNCEPSKLVCEVM